MKNLENKSFEGTSLKNSSNEYLPMSPYEGLELIEEGKFKGPTSIKYWM